MMDHIKVELDFIPVKERLPEDSELGRIKFVRSPLAGIDFAYLQKVGTRYGWIHPFAGEIFEVTHWAEIPKTGG